MTLMTGEIDHDLIWCDVRAWHRGDVTIGQIECDPPCEVQFVVRVTTACPQGQYTGTYALTAATPAEAFAEYDQRREALGKMNVETLKARIAAAVTAHNARIVPAGSIPVKKNNGRMLS